MPQCDGGGGGGGESARRCLFNGAAAAALVAAVSALDTCSSVLSCSFVVLFLLVRSIEWRTRAEDRQ